MAKGVRDRRRCSFLTAGALLMLSVLAACGSNGVQQVKDVDEVLVRTAASVQAQNEMLKVGAQLSGPMSCTTSQQDSGVQVSCTGTTLDGKPAQVTGTATSLPGGSTVQGDFVGTVAGQQVFALKCLGCAQ